MKTYYANRYRDSFLAFESALQHAGFFSVDRPEQADMLFLDHEWRLKVIDRPLFLYPHTPYAFWFWDGIIPPSPRTVCNFVVADGARLGMERYGYPYRVEVVGFSRCPVKPFQATKGRDLLFAPPHPFKDGKFPRPGDRAIHQAAMRFIAEHRSAFGRVVVRYASDFHTYGLESYGFDEFLRDDIVFTCARELSVRDALQSMESFDLMISTATFGYLALASGKPTILYGYKGIVPGGRQGDVKQYELYRDLFEFPCPLECLTIDEVLRTCQAPRPDVESWKALNIGHNFDVDKFISIVEELS